MHLLSRFPDTFVVHKFIYYPFFSSPEYALGNKIFAIHSWKDVLIIHDYHIRELTAEVSDHVKKRQNSLGKGVQHKVTINMNSDKAKKESSKRSA